MFAAMFPLAFLKAGKMEHLRGRTWERDGYVWMPTWSPTTAAKSASKRDDFLIDVAAFARAVSRPAGKVVIPLHP